MTRSGGGGGGGGVHFGTHCASRSKSPSGGCAVFNSNENGDPNFTAVFMRWDDFMFLLITRLHVVTSYRLCFYSFHTVLRYQFVIQIEIISQQYVVRVIRTEYISVVTFDSYQFSKRDEMYIVRSDDDVIKTVDLM